MLSLNQKQNQKKKCGCDKVCYDKRSALTKKNSMMYSGMAHNLRVYQHHGCWHITSDMHDGNRYRK